jgi:hypothetical protein
MRKEILVAMTSQNRIEDIIPCLERVARPGMKVTFLVRYPADGFSWPKEKFGRAAALAETHRLAKYYSWQENQKRAQRKVSPAFEALQRKGAEVAVNLYAGSLKRAIKTHAPEGGDNLVMMPVGIGQWITSLFNGTNSVLRLFKRPGFSLVHLIQPGGVR